METRATWSQDPQSKVLLPTVVFPEVGRPIPWTSPLLTKPCVQLVLDAPTAAMAIPHVGWGMKHPSLGVFSTCQGKDGVGGCSQLAFSDLMVILHLARSPDGFILPVSLKESWFSARSPKDGAGCWVAREGLTLPSKLTSTWTQMETLVELKQSFRSPRGVQSCLCSASKTNALPAIGAGA